MGEFVRIGSTAEMPEPGEAKEFEVNGRLICVANVDGDYSAMDNVCVHRGGPLGQGSVERRKVICPWHGWEFDPLTGAAAHNPQHRVAIYDLRIEGDDVLVYTTPLI
ncbi:MAG TPA: Rieske (2Fe-2S) protein [Terriglobales bacterium]|nr:Rieske (2Fe-2S) protein [Terriglobales bacterium]